MRKIKIVTDSCSDLKKSIREKYDIDYLQMFTVRDAKETPASLDWEYYSPKDLYDTIRDGNRVTTTQVPAVNFENGFKKFLDEGFDIVYIACSSKLSGSVNTGRKVAEEMLKDYPGATIRCVDSLNACGGEGLVAVKGALLRDEGLSADQEQRQPVRNRSFAQRAQGCRQSKGFLSVLRQPARRKAHSRFRQERRQHRYQEGQGSP